MDEPRPLWGRYQFVKSLRGTAKSITWLAHERATGTDVVACVVAKPRASGLAPILRARHEHVATILDLIEVPDPKEIPSDEPLPEGAAVAVAEYIKGQSLGARLDVGPLAVEDAVEWAARTADALSMIHRRGGVHGAVSPRALIVSRPDRGVVPILTHLVVPPSGAYCAPERVTGAGPSVADDLWALVATLYSALSRRAPFHGATRTELARAIVAADPAPLEGVDADLADLVLRGLSRDAASRFQDAVSLRGALRDWMERTGARSLGDFAPVSTAVGPAEPVPNVGDLSLVAALAAPDTAEARALMPSLSPRADDEADALDLAGDVAEIRHSGGPMPTPLGGPVETQAQAAPKAAIPASTKTTPPAQKRSSSKLVLALVGLGLVSAGIGAAMGRLRSLAHRDAPATGATVELPTASPKALEPSAPNAENAAPESAASAASIAAGASAAPGAPLAAKLDSSPARTAAPPTDFAGCVAGTTPEGAVGAGRDLGFLCTEKDFWATSRRFNLEVAKHGHGPGMVLWAHLGRFDLAAISYVWHRCCPADATPFVVATPKGVCDTLSDAVHAVGKDPSPANIDAYASVVECLFTREVHHPTEWWDRVGPKDARGYFDQLHELVMKAR